MSKRVTPEVWARFKDTKTKNGYTFHNAIQTGVETPHLGVGIPAGDEDCWEVFKDIYSPVIQDWHDWDPYTNDHKSDLDFSKIKFSAAQGALFDKYVASTRIRAARNLTGLALPCGTGVEDRNKVEALLSGDCRKV